MTHCISVVGTTLQQLSDSLIKLTILALWKHHVNILLKASDW